MKVTIIPILIGALGTVTKGLIQRLEDLEIREYIETILTIVLLGSLSILSPGDLSDFLSLKLQWEPVS